MSYHQRHQRGVPTYVQVILLIVACLALGGIFVYADIQDKKESRRLKQIAEEYRRDEAARAEEYRKSGETEADESDLPLIGEEVTETDDILTEDKNIAVTNLRTGVYSEYACSTTVMEAENYEIDAAAIQCLANDEYLYALSDDSLTVYRILDAGYEKITEYSGMGDTRDMAFTDDNEKIVVAAGRDGIYLFDVSDPEHLGLASQDIMQEDSDDTSVFITGDYAFLCSGHSGIEIVDISDLNDPVYASRIGTDSEYTDCFVTGGYLYAGVSGENRIDIYDVEDFSNPSLCSQIPLAGNGAGVFVSDGVLYAATVMDPADVGDESSDLSDYDKDTENGLEIFDVSDPENPLPLSRVKTLEQVSDDGNDGWDVAASGDYAYLSSRYNGLYVFDISNPEEPVCLDIYRIEAQNGSPFDPDLDPETDGLPYDTESITRGCIGHVWLQEGRLYAAASNMGIYKMEEDYITAPDRTDTFEYTVSSYLESRSTGANNGSMEGQWETASASDSSADTGWETASASDSSV